MFEKKYIKLIKNRLAQYAGTHKLIAVKILKLKFTKIQLNQLYNYLVSLPLFSEMDKNDALKQFIRLVLNNKFQLKRCLICGQYLSIDFTYCDRSYCSIKCKNLDKDRWLEKSKQVCLEKYGTEWSFSSENNKIKTKQTWLKKYGVQHIGQSEQINKKRKKTYLAKYGVDHPFKSKQIKQKRKQTCLAKYGVDAVLKSPQIQEKIKNNNLQKYGFKCTLQVPQIRQQIQKTNLLKYGTKNPIQSIIIKQRSKLKLLKIKYTILKQNSQYQPLFNQEDIGNIKSYNWKCKKCGNIFENNDFYLVKAFPRCLKCYPYCNGISLEEKQISDFLKDKIQIKQHDKTLISPLQLDIVIPQKKIAIEFNGSYYHSIRTCNDKNYHLNKTNKCQQNGYQLLHIWEYDWLNKQDIVKNKLKAILNIDQQSIYARKCNVKEISIKDKNEFLNKYHIQGEDKSSVKLGLFYEENLVAAMTFGKPRFNKNYQWELIRYATKSGYRVIGGAGKLLKYFERTYNPKSLITYADRSYSKGNMYKKIGFAFIEASSPNYFYTNNKIILSRYQCQKHKLKNLLGKKYNPNLSETENMELNRFYKIYNSGNLVFEKIY